jgi:hypothetical protein
MLSKLQVVERLDKSEDWLLVSYVCPNLDRSHLVVIRCKESSLRFSELSGRDYLCRVEETVQGIDISSVNNYPNQFSISYVFSA